MMKTRKPNDQILEELCQQKCPSCSAHFSEASVRSAIQKAYAELEVLIADIEKQGQKIDHLGVTLLLKCDACNKTWRFDTMSQEFFEDSNDTE